ncbi:TonB-dependent receptor domain-containing protein [Neisseria weixii]|uniref:TonB-dependent receptor domain-containing protein n=1 Tax=Neisseria weixii TaxID=1853276 RepID=UPI00361091D0
MKPLLLKRKLICSATICALLPANTWAQTETENEQVALEPIVVMGTAVPTKVTRKRLDQTNTTDLKQVMKNQIGMSVGGGNGVAQYYSIRGIGEDKIVLDVDNTSQSTKVFHHQSRFQLDPALLKSINVEKGTGSASAGIGAVAGVIRATTVDAKDLLVDDKPFGFRVGAGYSSNKGHHSSLAAYTYQNGFSGLIAGNFLNNGEYKSGGELQKGSKLNQRGLLAKIGYDFNPDHTASLSYRQEYQKGSRSNKAEFRTDEYRGFPGAEQKEQTLNAQYTGHNIGFINKLDINAFQIRTEDIKPPKDWESGKNVSHTGEKTTAKAIGGNADFTSSIFDKHTLKYGINYRRETSVPSDKATWLKILNVTPHSERKTDIGVYAEGIWDLSPITLTTGLRYDHFNWTSASDNPAARKAKAGQINPSLGVIWEANPNLTLLATLNQASRSPRLNEALLANERAGAVMDINPDLKAETARRAEAGFKWKTGNFDVSGSVFRQKIDDLIIYKWANISKTSVSKRGAVFNNGSLNMNGYELDASYRNGGLTARVGVSHTKPKIQGNDIWYGETPLADEHHESSFYFWNTGRQWLTGLSYRFENPKLEIGWLGRYAQSTKYTDTARRKGTLRATKSGYGVHDIYANWQPLKKDTMNVNFAVNNVTDKKFRSHSQHFPDGEQRVPFYERGREFVLSVNYRF